MEIIYWTCFKDSRVDVVNTDNVAMTTVQQNCVPCPHSLGSDGPAKQLQFGKTVPTPLQQFIEPSSTDCQNAIQVQPVDNKDILPPPSYNGKLIGYVFFWKYFAR